MSGLTSRSSVVAEAHAIHDAGAPVVDDDVGLGGKAQGDLKALRVLGVNSNAALIAIEFRKAGGIGAAGLRMGARLNLDDVRAKKGEERRRNRARHRLRKVHHSNAVQRLG